MLEHPKRQLMVLFSDPISGPRQAVPPDWLIVVATSTQSPKTSNSTACRSWPYGKIEGKRQWKLVDNTIWAITPWYQGGGGLQEGSQHQWPAVYQEIAHRLCVLMKKLWKFFSRHLCCYVFHWLTNCCRQVQYFPFAPFLTQAPLNWSRPVLFFSSALNLGGGWNLFFVYLFFPLSLKFSLNIDILNIDQRKGISKQVAGIWIWWIFYSFSQKLSGPVYVK